MASLKPIVACILMLLTTTLAANSTSDHVIKNEPIIINTQLQNYDQPTFSDYKECTRNRDQCLQICLTAAGPEKCTAECPVCPVLHDHDVVVQGYNDTNYKHPETTTPLNTTNVIRLTNEIRNIIENKVETRNVNNVAVHQNISDVGGKYGLGYNEHGACCYVIRTSRHCEQKNSQSEDCETKKHRVCGERCKARVMYARRVRKCENVDTGPCEEHVEYVAKKRTHHHNKESRHGKRINCERCWHLTYIHVLRYGVPMQCSQCFQGFMGPLMPIWYPTFAMPYHPSMQGNNKNDFFWDENEVTDDENDMPSGNDLPSANDNDGWVLETRKCRSANGTITEDCTTYTNNEQQQQAAGNKDDDYGVPAVRRRRRHNNFIRSAYSHRQQIE